MKAFAERSYVHLHADQSQVNFFDYKTTDSRRPDFRAAFIPSQGRLVVRPNLRCPLLASKKSPAGTPLSSVRGVAQVARRRMCLPPASTSEVPFCAAVRMAMAVDLARRSAPERVRWATPTASAAERCSVCSVTRTHGLLARYHRCTGVTTPRGYLSLDFSQQASESMKPLCATRPIMRLNTVIRHVLAQSGPCQP